MKRKAPAKERISSFFERHPDKSYSSKQVANYLKLSEPYTRKLIFKLGKSGILQRDNERFSIVDKEEIERIEEIPPTPKKQHYRHYVSEFVYCDARNKFVVYALSITESKDDIESDLLDAIEDEYSHCDIIKNYGYSVDETDEDLLTIELGVLE